MNKEELKTEIENYRDSIRELKERYEKILKEKPTGLGSYDYGFRDGQYHSYKTVVSDLGELLK